MRRMACVAGVSAPAFVERSHQRTPEDDMPEVSPGSRPRPSLSVPWRRLAARRCDSVSPGSRPRPSLSGLRPGPSESGVPRVAGVSAPAFVERCRPAKQLVAAIAGVAGVSAPAFVERANVGDIVTIDSEVSPGSRPRPSLSAVPRRHHVRYAGGVAGVSAPAFVERSGQGRRPRSRAPRVAGVSAPAFVERFATWWPHMTTWCVAGVSAPAFVERPPRTP